METHRRSAEGAFSALPSGTVLDRYRIDSVIAAGGFGITYLAYHIALGKPYALKEHFPRQLAYREATTSSVRPTDPDTFSWALDRFIQEGRTLAQCDHANVVSVADVFDANGTAYMALAYEEGQSLRHWLDSLGRRPTQDEIDRVLWPLLDALEYVHGKGLLHRDIAPDNIIIRRDGTPCLIDFGAARQAAAERSQMISAIVKSGYSPQEQYTRSGRSQGPWSDIYALGATLYRAVAGITPQEATDRVVSDDLRPIADLVPDPSLYRRGFLAGIDEALRMRGADRPQRIADWRRTLQSDEAVVARSAVTPAPSPEVPPATAAPTARTGAPMSFTQVPSHPAASQAPVSRTFGAAQPRYLILVAGVVVLAGAMALGAWRFAHPASGLVDHAADAGTHDGSEVVRPLPPPKPPDSADDSAAATARATAADAALIATHGANLADPEPTQPQSDDRLLRQALERAMSRGDATATAGLGIFYRDGRGGLAKDDREAARLFRLATERGNALAERSLGNFYGSGRGGLAKDDREAARLYGLAANQGDAASLNNLGVLHGSGRGGFAQDEREAARLYRLAADRGLAVAQANLGLFYANGQGGLPRDDREAARLYRLAADQGHAAAQNSLGVLYEAGRGGLQRDEHEAARLFRLAADRGYAVAQNNLAGYYQAGRGGLARNDQEAARYYGLSAENGYALGQNNLGVFYENGRGGLTKSEEQAARLYRLAADQGYSVAQNNLALYYQGGRGGLGKNEEEAARLYRLSADQNYAVAQNNLGTFYQNGRGGLPKDDNEAARLYRLAADQGEAYALNNVGFFHQVGRGGLRKSDEEAVKYYRLSADKGNPLGEANLAFFYENGRGGLKKDVNEAVRLYRLSAAQGNAFSRTALTRLGRAK